MTRKIDVAIANLKAKRQADQVNLKTRLEQVLGHSDKLYVDKGEYDEEHESHLRNELVIWANYAESGPTFDPDGKYLCESCDMRKGTDQCMRVHGPISFSDGGCRIYVYGKEAENEADMPTKLTQLEATYSERPKEKAFGCKNCEYSAEAKKPDSAGRPSWCKFWGIHIIPTACCFRNDSEDDTGPKEW